MEIKIGDLFMNDDRDSIHVVTDVLPPTEDDGEPRVALGWSTPAHLSWWIGQGWSPCTQEEWDDALRDLDEIERLNRDWENI